MTMNLKDTITRRVAAGGIGAALLAIAGGDAGAVKGRPKQGKAGGQPSKKDIKRQRRDIREMQAWLETATCCADGHRPLGDGTCGNGAATILCRDLMRDLNAGIITTAGDCTPGCTAPGYVPGTDLDGNPACWSPDQPNGTTLWTVCGPVRESRPHTQ